MDYHEELIKIIQTLYNFVLVSSMGIFGSVSGILYSKEKLTKKEILANLFIACFISVIVKLVFYEFKNNFLLLAVIGTLCFNTKKAIGLIMLIPSIFLKTGALEKIIQAAVNESNEAGEIVLSKEEKDQKNNKISEPVGREKYEDQEDQEGKEDKNQSSVKQKQVLKKNDKKPSVNTRKKTAYKSKERLVSEKAETSDFEKYSDYNSENCLQEDSDSCECDDFNFCDSCSNQEKLLVLKRKKIYEMKSKIRNNRSKSSNKKEFSTTNKTDDEVK